MFLSVFIGNEAPISFDLEGYQKDRLTFGRGEQNDIVLPSQFVSKQHGTLIRENDTWKIVDNNSTNGLIVNGNRVSEQLLSNGIKVYIGSPDLMGKIVLAFSAADEQSSYQYFNLTTKDRMVIGRLEDADITLNHVGVSRTHVVITRRQDGFYLKVLGRNGIVYNGMQVFSGEARMQDMDRFLIMDTQFLYRSGQLVYYRFKNGLGLDVCHVYKDVKSAGGMKRIVNDVSFQIQPGEFVAIVGGSGAGKSSILKCVSCCTQISGGRVLLQGEDIITGYESLKQMIGYVPQTDIVYDNLTLGRMLYYSAQLRMSQDSTPQEIAQRIQEVLAMVELTGHEQTMIGRLSGGQKKRASIAVELLSDPGIFFLDEPTSGLDPGTERNLMYTLKNMTKKEKTVILVTHTPLNLHLCDKILFMGYGGNLCFCGSPDEALAFFGVNNFVDIYNLVQKDPMGWRQRFEQSHPLNMQEQPARMSRRAKNTASGTRQMRILAKRYLEMIVNDRKKLLMQLLMAPGLGILLYIAFSGSMKPFKNPIDTETFSLALSCCCFWIGLFQSIQEVCKERSIVEREKMTDVKVGPYLASKMLVLGGILLFQCLLLLLCVWIMVGKPEYGMVFDGAPFLEYMITTYLTAVSAATMGLCVSCIVSSTDQAVAVAPLLLIPQILFAQVICSLKGFANVLSWFVSCQWSCLAYTGSADSYNVALVLGKGISKMERYEFPSDFIFSLRNPTPRSWMMLIVLAAAMYGLAFVAMRKRREI